MIINDTWAPTFTNSPDDGRESVAYAYGPTFNETATVMAHSTNAPFLTWNGSAYVGTPDTTQSGTYWINVSATSTAGLLTAYQNETFTVNDTWEPTFITTPGEYGRETIQYTYGPGCNESVTWTVNTNAPFLSWNGSAYVGTPDTTQSGTYWINISATSTAGLLTAYQNYTLVINDTWAPTFTNGPANGKESVAYAYGPTFNETATISAYSTNAPFLTWNGSAYVGTPSTTQAGTYWINISATSTAGLLTAYQNCTLVINDTWEPTFTSTAVLLGKETVAYEYDSNVNESATFAMTTNAGFLSIDANGIVSGTPSSGHSGSYYVNISATSTAGLLTAYQNYTLIINDSWSPTFESDQPEDPFFSTLEYEYQVEMNESCSFTLDTNATFLSISDEGNVSGTLVAGTYYVRIGATSDIGLLTEWQNYTLVVLDDSDAPVMNITTPIDGACLNIITIEVEWTGDDGNGSGMIGYWLRIDDGDWEAMNMSTNATLELAQGMHTIVVKAIDEVGNEGNGSVEIHISTTTPVVESATPTGDDVPLTTGISMTFSKEMDHDSMVMTVNGTEVEVVWVGETVTYSPEDGWAEDSAYTVIVSGVDIYGNHMQYSWQFSTETLPVLVEGVIVDDGGNPIENATLTIDNETVAMTNKSGHFSFEIMPGNYTLTISKDGYTDKTQQVIVDEDDPLDLHISMESETGSDLWIILLVACIISALVLIAYIWKKKQGE